MSAEPNAVYRMPMRTVSPQERRAKRRRPVKKAYVLSSPEFDEYLRTRAAGITIAEIAAATLREPNAVRGRCRLLGVRWKADPHPNARGEKSARDDFRPQPRDISELPAMPGSPERKAALAKLVAEGKELFIPEDRDRVNEALMAAGGARIEAFSMERAG